MSYNTLNLPDGTIEGHKYSGGGVDYIHTNHSLTTSNPATWTATNDCLYLITASKASAGYAIIVFINEVRSAIYDFSTAVGGYASMTLPVKKGDVVRIECNGETWDLITYAMWYR